MEHSPTRWRILAVLYLTAGPLACLSTLLPNQAAGDWAVVGLGATAVVIGTVLWAAAARLPESTLPALLVLGTLMISAALLATRDAASPLALLYVWAGVEAFFFLRMRGALPFLAFIALCYAVTLMLLPAPAADDAILRWLLTISAILVTSGMAAALQARSDRLNRELADAARTDALTGLLNRRGFAEIIEDELERARRGGTSLAVIAGDLDHFKAINDRFGHSAGDDALRAFAELCATAGRRIDSAARTGGEEFALVLPQADEHGALLVAERLRRAAREHPLASGARLSVSFGIASFPRDGTSSEALLQAADRALYVAKQLGRDRSVLAGPHVDAAIARDEEPEATLEREHVAAVVVLAETMDLRDSGTALHSQTVSRYAELTARALGLSAGRTERIRLAGLLHDLGKVGVPDGVLQKPGALTDSEWAEIRKHPELGARILAAAELDDIAAWVLAHHERPDGRGYPFGLAGDDIPLEARILAVADAYEAMTADRVYRASLGHDAATVELRRCAGEQFDAGVVEAFIAALAAAGGLPAVSAR